ncbi:hypothetical protein KIN_01910 [Litoreibacter roseus]|uniref:DUF3592 domain-containing protein n=1 Tax=Litoreibacter roseus TaxID=2601869 RepID=A0A6N6JAU3_9RHOB|nr:hypothetical protein KIN_01910 [Litoreibacter roseus]
MAKGGTAILLSIGLIGMAMFVLFDDHAFRNESESVTLLVLDEGKKRNARPGGGGFSYSPKFTLNSEDGPQVEYTHHLLFWLGSKPHEAGESVAGFHNESTGKLTSEEILDRNRYVWFTVIFFGIVGIIRGMRTL